MLRKSIGTLCLAAALLLTTACSSGPSPSSAPVGESTSNIGQTDSTAGNMSDISSSDQNGDPTQTGGVTGNTQGGGVADNGNGNHNGNGNSNGVKTTAGKTSAKTTASSAPTSASPTEKPAVLTHDYKPAKEAPVNVTGKKYYVSASAGNDGNEGTLEKPFKTISKAASVMQAGDACYIREGVYRETVKPSGSGTASAPMLFSAYNNEKVVVSGADVITSSFQKHSGNIYVTDVSGSLGVGKNQIFVDGEVLVEARYPNEDVRSVSPVTTYSKLFPTRGYFSVNDKVTSRITSLFLDQPLNYWKDALYVGGNNVAWTWQTAIITSSKSGQLTVGETTQQWWFPRDVQTAYSAEMSEGYITNTLNALDKAGEWYIGGDKLYIWMPKGDAPASHTVEMKKRVLAFDLTGKKNIYLFGIDIQAASVTMAKAENCTLDKSTASYISHFQKFADARDGYIDGGAASEANSPMNGQVGIYVSGKNNAVINSTIRYSAGAGIYLAGYGTRVENNLIHDTGYACTYVSGIFADEEYGTKGTQSNLLVGGYTIKYNTIYNTGRSAISFNSINDGIAQYAGSDISYNQMYNNCLFTSDGGTFYAYFVNFSADGNKTNLHHNLVWNNFRKSGEGILYTDNQCEGISIHDNLGWGHYYANQFMVLSKTDTKNKNNLPSNSNNKFLGVSEAVPNELPDSAYPGGKGFFTGVKHGEDPNSATVPAPTKATSYQAPQGKLSRDGWKASASSSRDETSGPEKAIDDDPDYTYWRIEGAAQAAGDWFMLDLGKKQSFSRIILKCGNPKSYNSPRSYTVLVSDDGQTWSAPVAMGDSCSHELDIRLSKTQTARYVRIEQQEKTMAEWGQYWRIMDINLYAK